MIAIRIHPHQFDHFHRRLRAIPLAVCADTPLLTIRPLIIHILTLPSPLHGRRPLAQIPGLPINTPPNQHLDTSASTPKLQIQTPS